MVNNINAGGDSHNNQINDLSKSTVHGDVTIGNWQASEKNLSDCERIMVSEKSLRNSILAEMIVGLVSLIVSAVVDAIKNSFNFEYTLVLDIIIFAVMIITLLIGLVLLSIGVWKFFLFRKLRVSNEFIEMPSTVDLFLQVLSRFSNSKEQGTSPYIRRGRLYRNDCGEISEYLNAGECNICEEGPRGKLQIKKTGNREYECICTQNPKHIFDFDFTKK